MDYDRVLANAGEAGIFACPPERGALNDAVRRVGLSVWEADLAGVRSKAALLERLRSSLPLETPADWDDLDEALSDAIWEQAAGVALTLLHCTEFAQAEPEEFETALEVFDSVAESCYDEDIAFWVFVDGVDAQAFDLPMLEEIET